MRSDDVPPVTGAQIEAVLAFLPVLEDSGFSAGQWHMPEGQFPYFALTDVAIAFIQALYANRFVYPFDWPSWQAEAQRYLEDPGALQDADLETLRKLVTTLVRKDRFVEGYLASMFEEGHLLAILRRLQQLHEDLAIHSA